MVGMGAADVLVYGSSNVAIGDDAGPVGDFHATISLGRGAKAQCNGDLALGSRIAPLRVSGTATTGGLSILNPVGYLPITLNGVQYKLPLFMP